MEWNLNNLDNNEYLKDKKKIFLYDRGYPSIEFFEKIINHGQKFVMRLKTLSYKQKKLQCL
jgi:hypothetical protein